MTLTVKVKRQKALDLLESDSEDVFIEYDEESSYEQILADISSRSIKTIDGVK